MLVDVIADSKQWGSNCDGGDGIGIALGISCARGDRLF